jgi:hypothetical protein
VTGRVGVVRVQLAGHEALATPPAPITRVRKYALDLVRELEAARDSTVLVSVDVVSTEDPGL